MGAGMKPPVAKPPPPATRRAAHRSSLSSAQRIATAHGGRVIAQGTFEQVKAHPAEVREAYMGVGHA